MSNTECASCGEIVVPYWREPLRCPECDHCVLSDDDLMATLADEEYHKRREQRKDLT